MWRPGSKLVHPFNPELGVGVVHEVEGRFLVVYFPLVDRELTMSVESGIRRLVLAAGEPVRHIPSGEEVKIAASDGHEYLLADGRRVPDADIWPIGAVETPVERLAGLRLDRLGSFRNRLEGLDLMQLREAGDLGSFLGGRIELFPHQLHTALRAVEADPVRWLLADEVGLGKTVEACLILSALLRTGRAQRALVVAPSTLTIQWLGELYRKFHQVFVLLDQARIESVEIDLGEGLNPFEVHPFAVISLELLGSDRRLLRQAADANLDLIVVDEAHRLVGLESAEAVAPLVRSARHALLLTATPLQANREGFYRLLAQLHPELYSTFGDFEKALERGEAVVPCTSAVRRSDVGGLPSRVPNPVDVGAASEDLTRDDRAAWLVQQVPGWVKRGEKALVFVRDVATVEALARFLESTTRTRVTLFHEDLSPAKRDIEVAAFRESPVPILLSSEAGAEGRNFQFCDRMVHYDLPFDPVELEQRIGRLDRIGRVKPVEIVYFRQTGAEPDVAGLFERLGLFERAAAGLDLALASVAPAIEAAAAAGAPLDADALVARVRAARETVESDIASVFYRDGYTPDQAASVMARVPEDLEIKTAAYCRGAARDLGFDVVDKGGEALCYIEFGAGAKVDSLPGVAGGSRFLGTFDRAEAVTREEVDFFASGHPLVEGLLLELEDGLRGRAALMEVPSGEVEEVEGAGLLCIYKRGPDWRAAVVSADGTLRPTWAAPLLAALPAAKKVDPQQWGIGDGWAEGIRALAACAEGEVEGAEIVAAAFFRTV